VVVQPNIDPYKDKFEGMSPDEQLRRMLQLAETVMDSQTQFILLPETALQGGLEENTLLQEGLFQLLHSFLKVHPGVTVVGGMDSYRLYTQKEKPAITSRKVRDTELWYNSYNAAFCTNGGDSIQVYHKSKLVPGVEKMPYPYLFGFIERYAIDLGGTSGSLSTDPESRNLGFSKHVQLAPIICYESVFGAYVSSYVNKGADVLCIITNDGWWGNTPGYRQHFDFGRLRAIENRRYLVRSANTGISAVIDEKGNVLQATEYWKEAAFKADVPLLRGQTYYAKNGDWVVGVMLVLLIVSNIGSSFVLRKF
jgi:apolipoprotein N-acyltransferase